MALSSLLLSTGSVSVKLSKKLKTRLENDGHSVQWLLTRNAREVWSSTVSEGIPADVPTTDFESELTQYRDAGNVIHIDAVNSNDVCVICPADFNIIGKLANGIADDLVSSSLAAWLGSGKPLFIAEAMNNMMYANPVHLENVKRLNALSQVQFILPTVKKLACGDYGIGGLAHVNAIADLVEGVHWKCPIAHTDLIGSRPYVGNGEYSIKPPSKKVDFADYLPKFDEPGAFGAKRKHDRHEGVDIYCKYGSRVYAVEDGEVVDSYQYTGEAADCGWWQDTWCIKVKGKSGVVTYGELKMPDEAHANGVFYPEIGAKIKTGDFIGVVGTVLKEGKLRLDIRNHNTSMLHMELRTENCHIDGWKLDGDRDPRLLDPTPYLHDKHIVET